MTSYAATFVIYAALGWPFSLADLSGAASTGKFTPSILKEVASALGVGLMLAIVWLYSANYKWVSRLLQSIGATKTDVDEDVWDFAFNSPGETTEYVNFRDFDNRIIYSGVVKRSSATANLRELVLRNVEIYDFDGNKLLDTPLLYLARKPENSHLEFPNS